MAAPALALLWADQSEAAAFRAAQRPGPMALGSSWFSPALLEAGRRMMSQNDEHGSLLHLDGKPTTATGTQGRGKEPRSKRTQALSNPRQCGCRSGSRAIWGPRGARDDRA
jgi:hypothetical protein